MNTNSTLYIVSTPIGNLGDITIRAIDTLKMIDIILAEDTRVSSRLLNHLGITSKKFIPFHDHNESEKISYIKSLLDEGNNIALISDAGTPIISDPGYKLIHQLKQENYSVIPIPGVSACITALSASGLPSDKFQFLGFLPHKSTGRIKALEAIKDYDGSTIIYESVHRIEDLILDATNVFSPDMIISIGRELTKKFEEIITDTLANIQASFKQNPDKIKGEYVVIFPGFDKQDEDQNNLSLEKILKPLITALPLKQAVKITCEITDKRKNEVYELALQLKEN
jgi:16S rRNA (cytidine1402-2'-O)-methyltransferase